MVKGLFQLTCSILIMVSFGGCRNKPEPGHYEGSLYWQQPFSGATIPVGIEISYREKQPGLIHTLEGQVEVSDQNHQPITSIRISHVALDRFDLELSRVSPQVFHMKKQGSSISDSSSVCYSDQQSGYAELCFDGDRFHLELSDSRHSTVFHLSGDAFSPGPSFQIERPVQMSLDAAIARALSTNLDARIGFERTVQAKYTATAAYLNLIPHLTTNLIWNAEPGYVSAVATLQGLAPFLLPTYWLQAKESQLDFKIKKDAEVILKADLAVMVEQLAYAYDRDLQMFGLHERTLASLNRLFPQVQELERSGKSPAGSADALVSLRTKIESNRDRIKQVVTEDRYSISQALGFHNPEAVQRVFIPPFALPNHLDTISKEKLASIASKRSFELRQIDYLRKIAELKKVELCFAWIDPTGDPRSSFGFNTIAQLKVSGSQLREIDLKREQVQQGIYQSTYRIADQYNSTIEFMNHWSEKPEAETVSLDSVQPEKLATQIEASLSEETGTIANVAAHRIVRSKVERLLLSGYYQKLWD